jgi:signal transduction histidine kinase
VPADEVLIETALRNLIANAVRHNTSTPPQVHVEARAEDGGWRIEVTDNGVGIAPEDRERIFEAFSQARGPTDGGSGLGLALVARVAERHRGRAFVEARAGGGSTFVLWLPG